MTIDVWFQWPSWVLTYPQLSGKTGEDIFSVNKRINLVESEKLKKILAPQNLLKMGFTLKDITEK